jgi:hypothetical protein
MNKFKVLFIVFLLGATGVQAQSGMMKKLSRWMAGSYSSYDQHISDSANYYHIEMEIVPIWQDRKDGYWFYVEQALAGNKAKPYRQRVYHLWKNQWGEFVSSIYKFPNPKRYVQQWQQFENEMTPADITRKDGCDVILNFDYDKMAFIGGTAKGTCESKRSGSTYAVAKVTVYKNELHSWDRGFDADGNYVWGAEKAGYVFLKE